MNDRQYWEMVQEEEGAKLGDARRCPVHGYATSSGDGMFDCPCPACEAECDFEVES